VVAGNTTEGRGGGVFDGSVNLVQITNTTIAGNSAEGLYSNNVGTVRLWNTIVSRNESTDVDANFLGEGNLVGIDPGFAKDPTPGPDGLWGTADDVAGDFHLMQSSIAINNGRNGLAMRGVLGTVDEEEYNPKNDAISAITVSRKGVISFLKKRRARLRSQG